MEKQKEQYIAPTLTVVNVKVEQGFTNSSQQSVFQTFYLTNIFESYDTKSGWGEEDNHFFD